MLENTISELKKRKNDIDGQIASLESEAKKLDQAINVLSKLSGRSVSAKPAGKRRKMSAAAIAKIRAAQKKRWAAWHKAHGK